MQTKGKLDSQCILLLLLKGPCPAVDSDGWLVCVLLFQFHLNIKKYQGRETSYFFVGAKNCPALWGRIGLFSPWTRSSVKSKVGSTDVDHCCLATTAGCLHGPVWTRVYLFVSVCLRLIHVLCVSVGLVPCVNPGHGHSFSFINFLITFILNSAVFVCIYVICWQKHKI